jgi:hypothetical protein
VPQDAPPYVDRVQETSLTSGTGAVTLSGAVTGYQAFSVKHVTGNRVFYCITNGVDWEVGAGTYNSVTPSVSRDTVLDSSNAGALVNFPVGSKLVFETLCGTMIADKGLTMMLHMAAIPQ